MVAASVSGMESVVDPEAVVAPADEVTAELAAMLGWLGALASWNPLSATATATRELFGNPTWASASWVNEHALLLSVIWPVAITAVFAPLAVRAYRRLGG